MDSSRSDYDFYNKDDDYPINHAYHNNSYCIILCFRICDRMHYTYIHPKDDIKTQHPLKTSNEVFRLLTN